MSIVPAGTIAGIDLATQIIARVHGPEWMAPILVCEYSTGQIEFVGGPPDIDAAGKMLEDAYDLLTTALQTGRLVAQIEADQRRWNIPATYWATGSAYRGIREGRLLFTGGGDPHEWQFEGRFFS